MSLYHEIPFLRNVALTDLIQNYIPSQNRIGASLIPNRSVITRETEWEVVLGANNIAPIVAWDAQSPLVGQAGIKRYAAKAVDIREKFEIGEADILFLRNPGERESSVARDRIRDQVAKMKNDVENRLEKMRFDVFLTGVLSVNDTVDGQLIALNYDFGIPAASFRDATDDSGAAVWSDQTNADARLNFEAAKLVIRNATGQTVTSALMNENTRALINHQTKIRQDLVYVSGPSDLVRSPNITDVLSGVRIQTYDDGYKLDVNGESAHQYFLPDNKVIFFVGPSSGGERFGDMAIAPSLLADGSRVDGMFAEQWTAPDPTREYIRVGIVAIPRVFHPDWFVTLTVNA
jgi:hypothetical protein